MSLEKCVDDLEDDLREIMTDIAPSFEVGMSVNLDHFREEVVVRTSVDFAPQVFFWASPRRMFWEVPKRELHEFTVARMRETARELAWKHALDLEKSIFEQSMKKFGRLAEKEGFRLG